MSQEVRERVTCVAKTWFAVCRCQCEFTVIDVSSMANCVEVSKQAMVALQEYFMHALAGGGLNLRPLADRIWGGERDFEVLCREFCNEDKEAYVPEELVMQFLDCTRQIEAAYGRPDEDKPAPIGKLNQIARSIHHIVGAMEAEEASSP